MKKLLLAACVAVAAAPHAFAGDLPLQRRSNYVPPQVYNSLFNWTGFYAGVHGGYAWGSGAGFNPDGFVGGVQAGYNYQYSPIGVLGFETDISATSIDDKAGGAKFGIDYLGTIRARAGYTLDRVMFYVTGGAAYGRGDLEIAGPFQQSVPLGMDARRRRRGDGHAERVGASRISLRGSREGNLPVGLGADECRLHDQHHSRRPQLSILIFVRSAEGDSRDQTQKQKTQ